MTETPYVTPAQLRSAVQALANRQTISDDTLAGYVAEFEAIAEGYRGVAFTPRERTHTTILSPPGDTCYRPSSWLELPDGTVTALTSVTVDGAALDTADVIVEGATGRLWLASGWRGTVEVAYTCGYATPPPLVLRACREYVRSVALADASAVPRDVIAQSMEGSYTRFSTADWAAGRPTGYLEVDRLLNSLPDMRIPGIA